MLSCATQVLWGLGWAFSGGADVAWLADELDRPEKIDRVLAARSRWELCGGGTGLASFGMLAWAAGLPAAIVTSGAGVALLGIFVAIRFPEDNFTRVRRPKTVFRNGLSLSMPAAFGASAALMASVGAVVRVPLLTTRTQHS